MQNTDEPLIKKTGFFHRLKSWYSNLTVQVLTAIALGILLGVVAPVTAAATKPIADTFINMIKMVIAPVIFLTVVVGIGNVGNLKKLGRVGGKAILYFEIVTTAALLIGLVVANWVRPGAGVDTSGVTANASAGQQVQQYTQQAGEMDWVAFFTHIVPGNVFKAFAEGDILQVLFFSVLFGIAITRLGDTGAQILVFLEKISKAFFGVLHIVMKFAPIGAFAGMAFTIGKYGLATLIPLGKLMLSVYITMFLFIFIILNGIAKWYGFSLWRLLKHIKEEILIVLGTSSSESVLPRIMEKLVRFGCAHSVVGLVIPTGYSFNLDGTTIYLSMATIFLAQAYGIELSLEQQLSIIGILMLTSKGAAAVTGGGFVVLASTLAAVKVIPLEGIALLLGVDRFMSEARAITNLIGNAVATVVVSKSEREFSEGELFD